MTHSTLTPPVLGQPASLTANNFVFLQQYVHRASGIVLDQSKQYLLEARLLPLVKEAGLSSLNALSEQLQARPASQLGRLVVEAMTTNETLFFRDPATFDAIRTHVLPGLRTMLAGKRKLRIWSAASSTGQEAYSLAMMLLEEGLTSIDAEIVGTDLSSQVLVRARQGLYNQFEVGRGLSAQRQQKYFTPVDREWEIHEAARKMVRFEQLDLRSAFSHLGTFDLILCRNVLIYFDLATKRKILDGMIHSSQPEALLILGCGETIINVHDQFERKLVAQCTFYTKRSRTEHNQQNRRSTLS